MTMAIAFFFSAGQIIENGITVVRMHMTVPFLFSAGEVMIYGVAFFCMRVFFRFFLFTG